jgi:hypothetical protein
MNFPRILGCARAAAFAGAVSLAIGAFAPGGAQTKVLVSQETKVDGVTAEITEAKRKDGVLTIRMRVRNNGEETKDVPFTYNSTFDNFYITSGNKKYMILQDSAKARLAAQEDYVKLKKGAGFTWWAKFPAPPPEQKTINFMTPLAPPFEDIAITD